MAFSSLPDGLLHIYFFDVGQGDSILIRTPNDRFVLIDGGPDDKVLTELSSVMPFFRRRLDLVVLTHAHADHLNGLVSVVKRYDVAKVLITGVVSGPGDTVNPNRNPYYEEFLNVIADKKIELLIAASGRDFDLGGSSMDGSNLNSVGFRSGSMGGIGGSVFIDIIHPVTSIAGYKFENQNNASVVVKIFYGENNVLLTGDAEKEAENKQLMTDFDLSAQIVKLGHHGSKTASTKEYLNEVMPKFAVIQCGKENKFNHPHQETISTLSLFDDLKTYRTDLLGQVHFSLDPHRIYPPL